MGMLTIDGVGTVEVGPEFARLTPQQQAVTVDEIIATIKGSAAPAGPDTSAIALPGSENPPPAAPPPEPGVTAAAGRVASRAGEAAAQRFGDRPLGLSETTLQELVAKGALAAEGTSPTPIQLLNAVVYQFGAKAGDAILRSIGASIGALGGAAEQVATEAGVEQGMAKRLGRDVGGLTEAGLTVAGQPAAMAQGAAARSVAATQRATAGEAAAARAAGPAAAATTTQDFKTAARGFYQAAEDAGVVIKPTSMKALSDDVFATAARSGLDETLTKNALAAVNRLEKLADAKTGPVSLETLDRARQVAGDAATKAIIEAKGKTTNDLRIAEQIIDKIDDFVQKMASKDLVVGNAPAAAQAIVQARDLWSRAAKLDTVDRLVRHAAERAGGFTGSGFENALRTEFRALAKNDAKMKGFSADEAEAIRRISRGTAAANTARNIGRLAPTGPVSLATGGGAGAFLGAQVGMPVLGALAVGTAGFTGRAVATALAKRSISRLEEIIRTGGRTPFAASTLRRGNSLVTQLAGTTGPVAAGQSQRKEQK